MTKNSSLEKFQICKYCNKNKVASGYRVGCNDPECILAAKTASRTVWLGKKRPDHGLKIKNKLTGKPKSEAHKKNLKTNSEHYKKKMLENKNIAYTDDNYIELWHKLISDTRKGKAYKTTTIKNWFNLTIEEINQFSDEKFDQMYKKYNSEKSLKALLNNPQMGRGLRETLSNLNFCLNKTEVITRSSFETCFIRDFLERLGIFYKYESEIINSYLPDFIVEINNNKFIIEIKGTIYDDKEDKLISDLLNCINKGYRVIIINTPFVKNWTLKNLLKYEVTTKQDIEAFILTCNTYSRKND